MSMQSEKKAPKPAASAKAGKPATVKPANSGGKPGMVASGPGAGPGVGSGSGQKPGSGYEGQKNGLKPKPGTPTRPGGNGDALNQGYAGGPQKVGPGKAGPGKPGSGLGGGAANVTAGAAAAAATAETFYAGLAARDTAAMASCYAEDVKFYDPLFRHLHGANEVMEMWNTITPAAKPETFKISHAASAPVLNGASGSFTVKVHWDANYDLGSRHIENHADSVLTIKDGKIIQQFDNWDLGAWMKQALPVGGGNSMVQGAISHAANSFIEIKAFLDKMA